MTTAKTKPSAIRAVKGRRGAVVDSNKPDAELLRFKDLLGFEIVRVLDWRRLTASEAEALTRIAAADFSRIRSEDLGQFTVDHLLTILGRLGHHVEVTIKARPTPSIADLVSW